MKAWTEGTGYDLQSVIDNYPWEGLDSGTVVDVMLPIPHDEFH
jgi:hypothetical protein